MYDIYCELTMVMEDKLLAYGDIIVNGHIRIHNVRLLQTTDKKSGEKRVFLSMPRYKTIVDGKEEWSDAIFPSTPEKKEELTLAITKAMREYLQEPEIEAHVTLLQDKGNVKGMATVMIDGFTIKNMRILKKKEPKEGEHELFVAMPQYQTVENGQEVYKDMAFPLNSSVRWHMQEAVLKEYDRLVEKQNREQANKEKGEEQRMPPNMTTKSRTK